jgi:UrcA family protein
MFRQLVPSERQHLPEAAYTAPGIATLRRGFATVHHKFMVAGSVSRMIRAAERATHEESLMNPSSLRTGVRAVVAATVFGFVGLGLCGLAGAEPSAESRTVKFADLNLSNASDAHVLYRRIRAAAEVACSHYFFWTDWDRARCVRDATAQAVTEINRPSLSAVYRANNTTALPSGLVSRSR